MEDESPFFRRPRPPPLTCASQRIAFRVVAEERESPWYPAARTKSETALALQDKYARMGAAAQGERTRRQRDAEARAKRVEELNVETLLMKARLAAAQGAVRAAEAANVAKELSARRVARKPAKEALVVLRRGAPAVAAKGDRAAATIEDVRRATERRLRELELERAALANKLRMPPPPPVPPPEAPPAVRRDDAGGTKGEAEAAAAAAAAAPPGLRGGAVSPDDDDHHRDHHRGGADASSKGAVGGAPAKPDQAALHAAERAKRAAELAHIYLAKKRAADRGGADKVGGPNGASPPPPPKAAAREAAVTWSSSGGWGSNTNAQTPTTNKAKKAVSRWCARFIDGAEARKRRDEAAVAPSVLQPLDDFFINDFRDRAAAAAAEKINIVRVGEDDRTVTSYSPPAAEIQEEDDGDDSSSESWMSALSEAAEDEEDDDDDASTLVKTGFGVGYDEAHAAGADAGDEEERGLGVIVAKRKGDKKRYFAEVNDGGAAQRQAKKKKKKSLLPEDDDHHQRGNKNGKKPHKKGENRSAARREEADPAKLAKIQAAGAATFVSAKLANTQRDQERIITGMKRQIAKRAADGLEAQLAEMRQRIASRQAGQPQAAMSSLSTHPFTDPPHGAVADVFDDDRDHHDDGAAAAAAAAADAADDGGDVLDNNGALAVDAGDGITYHFQDESVASAASSEEVPIIRALSRLKRASEALTTFESVEYTTHA